MAQSCWRGRPLPACRSIWITESGPRVGAHEAFSNGHVGSASAVGLLVNRSPRAAVGATLDFSTGSESGTFRLAFVPRYRRWLSEAVALDIGAGIAFLGEGTQAAGYKGLTALAALNYRGLVSLTAALESRRASGFGTQTAATIGVRGTGWLGALAAVGSGAWGVLTALGGSSN